MYDDYRVYNWLINNNIAGLLQSCRDSLISIGNNLFLVLQVLVVFLFVFWICKFLGRRWFTL